MAGRGRGLQRRRHRLTERVTLRLLWRELQAVRHFSDQLGDQLGEEVSLSAAVRVLVRAALKDVGLVRANSPEGDTALLDRADPKPGNGTGLGTKAKPVNNKPHPAVKVSKKPAATT
ncbi:hypothetical protein ACFL59_09320 [Planctomycetota bacterium]